MKSFSLMKRFTLATQKCLQNISNSPQFNLPELVLYTHTYFFLLLFMDIFEQFAYFGGSMAMLGEGGGKFYFKFFCCCWWRTWRLIKSAGVRGGHHKHFIYCWNERQEEPLQAWQNMQSAKVEIFCKLGHK